MDQFGHTVSDLRERPEFSSIVADRVWHAWWRKKDVPLEYIEGRVQENMVSKGVPFALVAHRADVFLGTVSVIASDMDERPYYSPWVAAVWVDAEHRQAGIGSSLVRAAVQAAFDLQVHRIYLCATPRNSGFYEWMGWERIEDNVAGLNIFSITRSE